MRHVEAGAAKAHGWMKQARGPRGTPGCGDGGTGATGHKRAPCALAGCREPSAGWGLLDIPCKWGGLSASGWSAPALICAVFLLCTENYTSGPVKACCQISLLPGRRGAWPGAAARSGFRGLWLFCSERGEEG